MKKEISTARYDYRQLQTALLPFMPEGERCDLSVRGV